MQVLNDFAVPLLHRFFLTLLRSRLLLLYSVVAAWLALKNATAWWQKSYGSAACCYYVIVSHVDAPSDNNIYTALLLAPYYEP